MAAGSLSQGQRQLFSLARAILRRRVRSRVLFGASSSGSESTHGEGGYGGGGGGGGGVTPAGKARGEGGILLLDEVSSSVDRDTDRAVQAIIEREFKGYTVVMVSHRLEAVMDFDRVIVMDSGRVVEAGPPRRLVEVEGGRFRDLWLVGNEE
ncbi:P-loop containing nucleoside triphosphate hydrolase protein [Phialemonium atrogriseum]|uniref:P-loop containing nucleoside triphosphate hydrolase protein n=1 Tax=Phialemonium atrogriseum TaxID=1093897 RepID=A0AAJ0C9N5_9PEZI|nr:P-loop containing nucleoside triphosphate hydrolase protein [Phialemonium atrogriseum]KAK1772525.1 P-loop containing nucleoside triphosphate hydrolase protein [Phialemonium atrogriseum]